MNDIVGRIFRQDLLKRHHGDPVEPDLPVRSGDKAGIPAVMTPPKDGKQKRAEKCTDDQPAKRGRHSDDHDLLDLDG